VLFAGELIEGEKAVLIYPTLWERDVDFWTRVEDDSQLHDFWDACARRSRDVSISAIATMISPDLSRRRAGRFDGPLFFVSIAPEGDLDRPIGLAMGPDPDSGIVPVPGPPPGVSFTPKPLLFTYERALAAAGTSISVPYADPDSHKGDYTLCIVVERLP
jgi:hypothetical protein